MYLYETHLHTMQASACAVVSGRYQAMAYKDKGYDGIIVTDHFFRGNSCVPRDLPWEQRVKLFTKGYEEAYETGLKIGLKVFFGWEESYDGQDFLIYGLDKEWLLLHPEVEQWTIKQQYEEVDKAGGMVIQAHPFRNRPYIKKIRLFPKQVHGVEVFNASNRDTENQNAYKYAKEYNLKMTAGGDSHYEDVSNSGVRTKNPICSINDYINLIKNGGEYELICN